MELKRIPREQVIPLADMILGFIDQITYHEDFDRLEILGHLLTGRWQALLVTEGPTPQALVIYEFREEYGKKICRLVLGCGKGLTKVPDLLDDFCKWCKAQGCNFVEGAGRHGWEKVLGPHGFVRTDTILRKPL
jgi:hypothetical protein